MTQMELITAPNESEFQDRLNDFLRRLESFGKLKDIKYSHSLKVNCRNYSATVFYETSVPASIKDPISLKRYNKVNIDFEPMESYVSLAGNHMHLDSKRVAYVLANREKFPKHIVAAAEVINARMNGGDSTTDMIDMEKSLGGN